MAVIPPWISVNPKDFVDAAAGGARIGAELAGQQNESNIAAGRNATALQEAQMRANAEQSAQQEEAQRAAQERALREWEMRQQILHQSAQLTGENQRSQNMLDAENARAANALAEREKYGNSMLDIRREANRIAQERVDKPSYSPVNFTTVSEHKKEVPDSKAYTVTEPEIHNWFSKNTPAKSLTTTNVADLVNLPSGSSIATNSIPGSGTPARTISHRIPITQDPYSLDIKSGAQQPQQRIRVKDKTGKLFTIPADQLDDAKKQGYSEVQ